MGTEVIAIAGTRLRWPHGRRCAVPMVREDAQPTVRHIASDIVTTHHGALMTLPHTKRLQDLTPEWLTVALREGGVCQQARGKHPSHRRLLPDDRPVPRTIPVLQDSGDRGRALGQAMIHRFFRAAVETDACGATIGNAM